MALDPALVESLSPVHRLALSYAPRTSRAALLALLALDTRFAGVVRSSREPMLAQLRLAWWREHLAADPASWPQGEPLLQALENWPGDRVVLIGLAAGWEALTGDAPLPASAFEMLADARAQAFVWLAGAGEDQAVARRMARNWALADIAGKLSAPEERETALALALAQDWRYQPLPRALRPLAVLHGLAKREIERRQASRAISISSFALAMRIGLLGR